MFSGGTSQMLGTSQCFPIAMIQASPNAAVFEAASYSCNFLNNPSAVGVTARFQVRGVFARAKMTAFDS